MAGEQFVQAANIDGTVHQIDYIKWKPGRRRWAKYGYTFCGLRADGYSEMLICMVPACWVQCDHCVDLANEA